MKKLLLYCNLLIKALATVSLLTMVSGAYADKGNCSANWDDFSNGFFVSNVADEVNKWFYFSAGPFIGDDGITTIIKGDDVNTLHVQPSGINPSIKTERYPHGTPKYTKYLAPEGVDNNPFSLPGGLDHVKWLVYMNHLSEEKFPGFTAPNTGVVSCQSRFRGHSYGTTPNPFLTTLIADPNDDLRLAASAMNVIDFQSYMVFDMFVSNEKVYAFYERLPFGRGQPGFSPNYAAFSYAIPVGNINSASALKDYHDLRVSYNKSKGTVTWRLDGKKVFQVDHIGYKLDHQFNPFTSNYTQKHPFKMLLDHGGIEELIVPNQLDCGMGMFTLLDGHDASGEGLVQISNAKNLYFPNNFEYPATAFDVNHYLWGEGSDLDIKRVKVKSPDVCPLLNHEEDNDDDDN